MALEKKSSIENVINEYGKHIDTSLIIENLKLSYTERIQKLQELLYVAESLKNAKKVIK